MPENDNATLVETLRAQLAEKESILSDVRGEAAKARVAKRTAVEDAKAAVEAELKAEYDAKLEAATKAQGDQQVELGKSKLQVAQLQAALGAVFPEEVRERVVNLAQRLVGTTEDELKTDADRVKKLFGLEDKPAKSPATDPSQGTGNTVPLNGDPLLNMMNNVLNKGH
jgi:polyribonucleotide nucleotidyltransferase